MKNNDDNFIVEQIRTKYTEKKHTDLERLKELDKKAERPAKIFSITFGIIATLIFGMGLCIALGAIEGSMGLGAILGTVGIGLCVLNFSLYNVVLNCGKKKYAPEILRLSEELLKK